MRRSELAALVLIAVASPILTWWLVGDLSEPQRPGGFDYIFEPLPLSSTQENLTVGVAAAAAVASATILIVHRRRIRWGDVRVLVPLVLVGVYCGLSWRVITAGAHGANIGGGLAMLALPVVLLVGALWAVLWRPGNQSTRARSPGQSSRR